MNDDDLDFYYVPAMGITEAINSLDFASLADTNKFSAAEVSLALVGAPGAEFLKRAVHDPNGRVIIGRLFLDQAPWLFKAGIVDMLLDLHAVEPRCDTCNTIVLGFANAAPQDLPVLKVIARLKVTTNIHEINHLLQFIVASHLRGFVFASPYSDALNWGLLHAAAHAPDLVLSVMQTIGGVFEEAVWKEVHARLNPL